MKTILLVTGIIIFAILFSITAGSAWGRTGFRKKVQSEIDEMLSGQPGSQGALVTEEDLEGLPEPVVRWLEYSGTVGKPEVSAVKLRQKGLFRTSPESEWMPFQAVEFFSVREPGLIWYTEMNPAPLFHISGRDKYLDGKGNMLIKLMSLVKAADASGPEIDQGAMLRYLNEIMWFPSAALSEYIKWNPVDSDSAEAVMEYKGIKVSAVFQFDTEGRLTNMTAQRYQSGDKGYHLKPWSTPISGYGEFNGYRLPSAGTGIWEEADSEFAYIKLEITEIEYNPEDLTL